MVQSTTSRKSLGSMQVAHGGMAHAYAYALEGAAPFKLRFQNVCRRHWRTQRGYASLGS